MKRNTRSTIEDGMTARKLPSDAYTIGRNTDLTRQVLEAIRKRSERERSMRSGIVSWLLRLGGRI